MSVESVTSPTFWKCVLIFIRNFHAVNRKIFACKINSVHKVQAGLQSIDLENASLQSLDDLRLHENIILEPTTEVDLTTQLESINQNEVKFDGFVVSMSLLSKKLTKNIEALGLVDFNRCAYIVKFIACNQFDDLCLKLEDNQLKAYAISQRVNVETSSRWCEFVLLPKLLKWCCSSVVDRDNERKPTVGSLQLLDVEAYNNLYKTLKSKHAERAMKLWTDAMESTDPLKFIYEDLAIAAYLICLWRSSNSRPTAFADLGCGNGLLVYILAEEGYAGYGFDIRARKLWSLYPKQTRLIEQPVEPDKFQLPVEVDWLIGNHSDELSPWLPVLAATSKYNMHYFLLPCCAYEFSGSKFQRRNSSLSVYTDFLEYAKTISITCGFTTLQDRLKIPSTKRIALVGIERTYPSSEQALQTKSIWSFVRAERDAHPHSSTEDIKLREQHESVRNCTQIDQNIIDQLVIKIFNLLMRQEDSTNMQNADMWNTGSQISMRDIVAQLSKEDLKHIKSECGGIKTLLRNKHEIFEFCGNNLIGVRKPQLRTQTGSNKPQTIKKRLCFFQQHHPNGCPLSDAECTFIHTN